MRQKSTDVERIVWNRLRNRQLGAKFRRQKPILDYIVDFVSPEHALIVELDGGQHAGSASDAIRTARLEQARYKVLRFWNNEVLGNLDGVLTVIRNALTTPSPLRGEGRGEGPVGKGPSAP